MANAVKRGAYDPYRNISYAYDGSAARVLEGEEDLQTRPQVRPRRQQLARPKVQVRQAGKVSPFAVVGFAVAAVMAVFILMSYVQLSAISSEVVSLNSQMTELQSREATLRARYEQAYDLGAIETSVTGDGSMSRPQSGQLVYVDLTEPDSVVVYDQEETASIFDRAEEFVGRILAYF
jgi:cell division protein FtsL